MQVSVYNTATARTTFGITEVTDSDEETVIATQNPSWTLTKVAAEPSYDAPGDVTALHHFN